MIGIKAANRAKGRALASARATATARMDAGIRATAFPIAVADVGYGQRERVANVAKPLKSWRSDLAANTESWSGPGWLFEA
ncbi:hypothetical protein GCM10010975_10180 [Comamonas phosphati]|nr:hypothetical protein GCM10010975_10180 [Comamonas phosphati]